MGGLSGTLTSLTQHHVPELEHLYEVAIGAPHRPTRDGLSAGHDVSDTLGSLLIESGQTNPSRLV